MPPRVYIETSIVSYLAARPAADLVAQARQRLTHEWWATRCHAFNLVIAQPVLTEAAGGDPAAAARRLEYVARLPLLSVTAEALALATTLKEVARLPAGAAVDALHIALATVHGIDYLLTWTCDTSPTPSSGRQSRPPAGGQATCRR